LNIILFFALGPPEAHWGRQIPVARLESVHGRVDVRDPQLRVWSRSSDGLHVRSGSLVRSSPTARAKLYFPQSGDTILLEPDSTVLIQSRRGQSLIEIQSGAVRVDQPVQGLLQVRQGRVEAIRESRIDQTPPSSQASETASKFVWISPDRDLEHESVDRIQGVPLKWEPISEGHVEIWSGPVPEELRLRGRVQASVGAFDHQPVLGRSFLQGRYISTRNSTQYGPLVELTARLKRTFELTQPGPLLSLTQTDQNPVAVEFEWRAADSFSGFSLSLKSIKTPQPTQSHEFPREQRSASLDIQEPGSYEWTLIGRGDSGVTAKQTGRIEIARKTTILPALEKLEPSSNQLTSFGADTSLDLKWRVKTASSRRSVSDDTPAPALFQIEVRSVESGETRRTTVKTQPTAGVYATSLSRMGVGLHLISVQGFDATGLEKTRPLQFEIEVVQGERPRWPASADSILSVNEIRPGTYHVKWPLSSEPSEYIIRISKDGKQFDERETKTNELLLPRLSPGRYRVEVRARGLVSNISTEPLIETWTVDAVSSILAPKIQKIEVER
jgi:hypothetical protein